MMVVILWLFVKIISGMRFLVLRFDLFVKFSGVFVLNLLEWGFRRFVEIFVVFVDIGILIFMSVFR